MCVCMRACTCVCTVWMYLYVGVCTCACVCMCVCVCVCVLACLHATSLSRRQLIRGDMLEWKVSHMWPLSCYGFAGRCLPELKDISPEELRWEAYLGRHAGTVQAYVQAERALLEAQKSVQSRYEDISAGDAAMLVMY